MRADNSYRYYFVDHLGSVLAYGPRAGAVEVRQAYGPYGEGALSTATDLRHGYAGHWWDAETGLVHMRARYYSRTLGRFMSPDPIGYGDGLSLYRYAANSPTVFWDPDGMKIVGWIVQLSKGGLKRIKPLFDEKDAVRARRKELNVQMKNAQASNRVENASEGNNIGTIRHQGHKLNDGSGKIGRPHYQSPNKRGHTFYSSIIATAISVLTVIEQFDPFYIGSVGCSTLDCAANNTAIPENLNTTNAQERSAQGRKFQNSSLTSEKQPKLTSQNGKSLR